MILTTKKYAVSMNDFDKRKNDTVFINYFDQRKNDTCVLSLT